MSQPSSHQSVPGATLTAIAPANWKSPLLLPFFPQQLHLSAMDWMFVSPPNSYAEILTPNVMVLGGRASERWLSPKVEVLMNGVHALIKETPESSLSTFPMSGCSSKRDVCEPGSRTHQTPNQRAPWSWTSFRTGINNILLFIRQPVSDILLHLPKLPKTLSLFACKMCTFSKGQLKSSS